MDSAQRVALAGWLLAAVIAALLLPAAAAADPPACDDVTLPDVHYGDVVNGQATCGDADGDPLSYAVTTGAEHGTGHVGASTGELGYEADQAYAGPDLYVVSASDGTDSVSFTVDVTLVNEPPDCEDIDLGSISHGGHQSASEAVDCYDDDGDVPTGWEIADQPAHGTASVQLGTIVYTPAGGHAGADSFTYRVSDGIAWSAPASVTVNLTNGAPQCSSLSFTIREDKPASAEPPCFDPDGDQLTLSVIDPPAHGTLTSAPGPLGSLVATYDPDDGFRGSDSFRAHVSDGSLDSDAFDVDLDIVANRAPACFSQTLHTRVGTALDLDPAVCWDPDFQDADSVQVGLDPAAPAQHGTVAPKGDLVTYTPDTGFTGRDAIGVRATDGELTTLGSVPLHVADTAFCSPAPTLRLRAGASGSVSGSCTAPGFALVGVSIVDQPTKGSVTQQFGAQFTYTADAGASGTDSFTFRATSAAGDSPLATQAIEIEGESDTKAPAVALAVAKHQKIANVLAEGVALALTLDEAATVKVTLTVGKGTARRLELDRHARRPVVVGTLTKALAAGTTTVSVKLTASACSAFKKANSVKLRLAVLATDGAGNAGATTGKVRLGR